MIRAYNGCIGLCFDVVVTMTEIESKTGTRPVTTSCGILSFVHSFVRSSGNPKRLTSLQAYSDR